MSKLEESLSTLEKARVAVLEAAVADRAYRLAGTLDEQGPVQRAVDRTRKKLAKKAAKTEVKNETKAKK